MRKKDKTKGFTLVEIIISIFIIAVALLAILSGFSGTTLFLGKVRDLAIADEYLKGKMEVARGVSYGDLNSIEGIEVNEKLISIQVIDPTDHSTTTVSVPVAEVRASYSSTFPLGGFTRSITFYIYEDK